VIERRPETPKFNLPPTVVSIRRNTTKALCSKRLARHEPPKRTCKCHSRSDTICATAKILGIYFERRCVLTHFNVRC
jgi:hypothetical protein